jgi:hypothetical protein
MVELPPGAKATLSASEAFVRVPLWQYWLRIARHQVAMSQALRLPDEVLDAMSAQLARIQRDVPEVEPPRGGIEEMHAALVAVTASAHAIDGFYGSIKPLINPPKFNCPRPRQILETLKLGFRVGTQAAQWQDDLDWLFDARDSVVHHQERHGKLIVTRMTEETIVIGAPESYDLTVEAAARPLGIAESIIATCLGYPKSSTKAWATDAMHVDGTPKPPEVSEAALT